MSSHLSKAKQESNERLLLRQIKGLKDNEESLIAKVEQLTIENKSLESDCKKLMNLGCRQCKGLEKCERENKEMFRWLMGMAGITILTLIGWWIK